VTIGRDAYEICRGTGADRGCLAWSAGEDANDDGYTVTCAGVPDEDCQAVADRKAANVQAGRWVVVWPDWYQFCWDRPQESGCCGASREPGRSPSPIDAGALVVFAPSLLLAVLLSGPFARRWGTSRWPTSLALASVAGIIAVTLRERDLLLWSEDIGAVLACVGCDRFGWLTDAELWSGVTQVQPGWLLNVVLFVSAGILLTLASGRPRRGLVGLMDSPSGSRSSRT
jgi:hypothetical protein